jgi:hypothetical protein
MSRDSSSTPCQISLNSLFVYLSIYHDNKTVQLQTTNKQEISVLDKNSDIDY